MPYVDYNLSLYRTGFRPYGMTNPFSATQLNGLGTGIQPFTAGGGQRPTTRFLLHGLNGYGLGQAHAMSPYRLHGMGQAVAVCLDQSQNTVSCLDPECTYGDCGSSAAQVTVGSLCLDQHENQVACADPNCTYGDCVGAGTIRKATTPGVSPAPGPSPRTYAPMTLFPQTAPVTSYTTASSAGAFSSSMLLPLAAVILIGALVLGKK